MTGAEILFVAEWAYQVGLPTAQRVAQTLKENGGTIDDLRELMDKAQTPDEIEAEVRAKYGHDQDG